MASSLQQAGESIQLNNYATLVILTAVGYDYILTFSEEVEHVWKKPWTRVSTLFVLTRYFGLCFVVIESLGKILFGVGAWVKLIFVCAADLILILRVWALYHRSRFVHGVLLTFYAIEVILMIVDNIVFVTQSAPTGFTIQVLDFSICAVQSGSLTLNTAAGIGQMALGIVMCLFIAIQFVSESLQVYKSGRQFRLNQYVNLFVKEGLIYFLAILLFSLLDLLGVAGGITNHGWTILFDGMVEYIPAFTLVPRFVLNLRGLYARDLQGRHGGDDVDTAFGLASGSGLQTTLVSAMVFAEGVPNEGEAQEGGDMPMEEVAWEDPLPQ